MIRGTMVLAAALFIAGCGEGECTSTAVGVAADRQTVSFSQCWDERDRAVECSAVEGGRFRCECRVEGNVGRAFERSEPLTPGTPPSAQDLAPINDGCGWELKPR